MLNLGGRFSYILLHADVYIQLMYSAEYIVGTLKK